METFLPAVDTRADHARKSQREKLQEIYENSEEKAVVDALEAKRAALQQERMQLGEDKRKVMKEFPKDFYQRAEYKELSRRSNETFEEDAMIRDQLFSARRVVEALKVGQSNKRKEMELTKLVHDGGPRRGFFLGDGAGMGKGRTLAGFIAEGYSRGRKKALWISVSKDLMTDAQRDLRDIGMTTAADKAVLLGKVQVRRERERRGKRGASEGGRKALRLTSLLVMSFRFARRSTKKKSLRTSSSSPPTRRSSGSQRTSRVSIR